MLTHLAYTNYMQCQKKKKRIYLSYFTHGTLCVTVLQHDNGRPHAAHTTQLLANKNVHSSPWPSLSPELNPNKHAWNESERRFRDRVNAPANVRELFQTLKQQWVPIPAQVIYNLIQSMPGRCWAVFDSRGGLPPTFLCVSLSRKTPSD